MDKKPASRRNVFFEKIISTSGARPVPFPGRKGVLPGRERGIGQRLPVKIPVPCIETRLPVSGVRSVPEASNGSGELRENLSPRIEALAVGNSAKQSELSRRRGLRGLFHGGAKEPPRAETGQAAEASKEAGAPGALLWGAEEASRVGTASEVLQAEGEAMGGQDKGGFRRFHQSVSFPTFSCGWHLEKRWRTGV